MQCLHRAHPEVELARGNSANYKDWYSLANKTIIPEGGVLAIFNKRITQAQSKKGHGWRKRPKGGGQKVGAQRWGTGEMSNLTHMGNLSG